MWTQVFIVEGQGYFPVDMLRYDCCHPADPESVDTVARGCRQMLVQNEHGLPKIRLRTYASTKGELHITVKRWESFGWTVIRYEQPDKR